MDNLRRFVAVCFCILIVCMTVQFVQIHKLIEQTKTEIVEVRDTIEKISYDKIFVDRPIAYKVKEIKHDTVRITDVKHDSVDAILNVIQKEYRDSTYSAWVSGYQDVNLDSIQVYQKTKTIQINNTNYITKYKNRPFSVGIQAGYGYDLMNKCALHFIGIGVQYNLFSFGKRK